MKEENKRLRRHYIFGHKQGWGRRRINNPFVPFHCRKLKLIKFSAVGLSIDVVGFESGQVQSVKHMQNIVSNTTDTPPPPPTLTHSSGEPERRGEGQQGTDKKAGWKILT